MPIGKYLGFFTHMVTKQYSYFFNNLEIGKCRKTLRTKIVSYDYLFEQVLLTAGECVPLSFRENGDHSIYDRLAGPLSNWFEQILALFGTFSQNFHFAAI